MVQAGRAQLRTVQLGLHTLGAVEVLDGLAEGEQVLVRGDGGDGTLQPGQRVRTSRVAWAPAGTNTNAGPGSGNGTGTGTAARAENAGGALSNAMGR